MTALSAILQRSKSDKEDWKYTDLEKLLAKRQISAAVPVLTSPDKKADGARLVFVDGVFLAKKSSFGAVPSCILMGDAESGYKLTLGEQTCLVAQPVEMVFAASGAIEGEIAVKLSIDIGANGRLTLMERHVPGAAVSILETQVTLQAHAKFVHGKIIEGGAHLGATKVAVANGANYSRIVLVRGASPARDEVDVSLNGEGAQATLNGVMLLSNEEHADATTRVTHKAAGCSSRQVYKSVLGGKARAVFKGKVHVDPGAQKTDGYQLSRALLLSDLAEMDAKPELEIYADDVKCSHGSTVGDLDEEAMFYLRSRGLPEDEARSLLIEAFIGEVIDTVQVEEWRAVLRLEAALWRA